jgi:hypothetical protein
MPTEMNALYSTSQLKVPHSTFRFHVLPRFIINYGKEIKEATNAEPDQGRRAQALWCSPRLAMQKCEMPCHDRAMICRTVPGYARMLCKLERKSPQSKANVGNKDCA